MVHIFVINSMIAPADFSQNLRASLAKHDNLQYHVFNTSGAGMEEDIVRRMIRYFEGQQLRFYCCGGSGTMRNILQGAEGNDNIEFAFCPLGRTNDFLKVFGEEIELFKLGEEVEFLELDEANCGAKLFSGLTVDEYNDCVTNFINKDAEGFKNLKYKDMIYKPMIEVVNFLKINNFDVYIVSGTDRYMIRTLCCNGFGIHESKIIGMDVQHNLINNQLIRSGKLLNKTVKEVKAEIISKEIGDYTILSFGNSSGDIQMHQYALSNPTYHSKAFMVVADDVTREYGYSGEVLRNRIKNWGSFTLISMANDWKTIYGDNVTII